MVVRHNLMAMNSQRQLSITSNSVSKSTEKLSSGYRVNRAADDAAGLAISEKMRRQVRGLTRATQNAEDGISMVQIADGALSEIQDMLQRMNELCVQAANGTNAAADRQNIQDEITQLVTEIDRVATTTKFNEIRLLDGSIAMPGRNAERMALNNQKIAEIEKKYAEDKERFYLKALNGANVGENVSADDLADMEGIKIIYIKDEVVTTQTPTGADTAAGNDKLKAVLKNEIVPNAVEAIINAYAPAYDFLKDSSIGMGLRIYNDPTTSTLAYVQLGHYNTSTGVVPNILEYQLGVNLNTLKFDSTGNLTDQSRNELEVTIVHEMMHAFMDEALTNGMTGTVNGVNANDRFPKWFIEGMAQTAAGGYYNGNDWVNGSLGINEQSTTQQISQALDKLSLTIAEQNTNEGFAASYGTGYLASMYLGYLAGGSNLNAQSIKSGLGKVLSEIRGGKSLQDVINDLTGKATIGAFETSFYNDQDVLDFVKGLTTLVGQGTGGVVGDLTKEDDILANKDNSGVKLFELNTTKETVQNKYPDDYGVFEGGSATNKGTAGSTGTSGGTVPWDKPLEPEESEPAAYERATGKGTKLHVGADSDISNKIIVYIDAMDAKSIGVDKVDVSTEDLASISIERVALALAQVSAQRSELGAYQNRLEHTVNNLSNVVENTTAAESQIRDTDMAKEMVAYSNGNILQQAGQAMLAQTNQANQGVLSLIS